MITAKSDDNTRRFRRKDDHFVDKNPANSNIAHAPLQKKHPILRVWAASRKIAVAEAPHRLHRQRFAVEDDLAALFALPLFQVTRDVHPADALFAGALVRLADDEQTSTLRHTSHRNDPAMLISSSHDRGLTVQYGRKHRNALFCKYIGQIPPSAMAA